MNQNAGPAVIRRTMREQLTDVLRERILTMEMKPGDRLIEEDLSQEFQVSRGPIRETLRQLEQEGLVQYEAHKGCFVRQLTQLEISENSLIRCTLEETAVRAYSGKMSQEGLAVLREALAEMAEAAKERDLRAVVAADEKFHLAIVEEAGFRQLTNQWKLTSIGNTLEFYTMASRDLMPYEYLERNHRWILDVFEQEKSLPEILEMIDNHYMVVPENLYVQMRNEEGRQDPINGVYTEYFNKLITEGV